MKKILAALLLAGAQGHAADLFLSTDSPSEYPFHASGAFRRYLEKCKDYDGIDIRISYLQTNRPSIDRIVNAGIPDTQAVETHVQEQLAEIADTLKDPQEEATASRCNRALHHTPRYFGHYGELEQIAVDYYEYSGGTHGLYGTTWYVFDENDQRLTPAGLLEKDGAAKLNALLEKAYDAHFPDRKTDSGDTLTDGTHQGWRAAASGEADNFYFNHKGLVFSYAPYTISSYSDGQIELLIPYAELKGIVKAEYLP